jgi:hypothetical protein
MKGLFKELNIVSLYLLNICNENGLFITLYVYSKSFGDISGVVDFTILGTFFLSSKSIYLPI